MASVNYRTRIVESVEELARYEKTYRGDRRIASRLRLLHLLKSGEARSVRQAAPMIGYALSHAQAMWERYRDGGLAAILTTEQWGGHRVERASAEALAAVEVKMESGEIRTLEEGRRYLRESWDIDYSSVQGVWQLFRRHRIKKKTGRLRHRKSDEVAQAAFQETSGTQSHRRTSLRFGRSTKDGSG